MRADELARSLGPVPIRRVLDHLKSHGSTGCYRRFLEYAKLSGDGKMLLGLLDELPDEQAKDHGLSRAIQLLMRYPTDALPQKAIDHAVRGGGLLSPELTAVLDSLEDWVMAHYEGTDDELNNWKPKRQLAHAPVLPQILLGRLLVLMAQAENVDMTELGWWWRAEGEFAPKYAGAWPLALFWLNAQLHEHKRPTKQGILSFLDFCAEWCRSAFVQLIVHQPIAAAFALTDVPGEMLTDLQVPWRAFRIQLPKSPVSFELHGAVAVCEEMWCWQSTNRNPDQPDGWMLAVRCSGNFMSFEHEDLSWFHLTSDVTPLSDLAKSTLLTQQHYSELDADVRAILDPVHRALVHIFLSAVLHVSAGHLERSGPKKPPKGKRWRAPKQAPETTDFLLGHDVKLTGPNLAPVVTAICRGERKFGRVQWIVRGHQRWQAHGPRHTLRKLIWVQPYWKGPVDAPILKRSYDLGSGVADREEDAVE